MNILTQKLPTAIEIEDRQYFINSDFRTCLKIILAFEDNELTAYEKQMVMLSLLYKEIPPNSQKACEMAVLFLNCGKVESTSESSGDRVYSFEKDASYIYTAIQQSHNIDLEAVEYLHWWKFCYMFMDMKEGCFFQKLIYYRTQRNKGKLTPEERQYCNSIKDILDLPQVYTAEEKTVADEFMRLLGKH